MSASLGGGRVGGRPLSYAPAYYFSFYALRNLKYCEVIIF